MIFFDLKGLYFGGLNVVEGVILQMKSHSIVS